MHKTLQLLTACALTAGVLAGCSGSPAPKTETKRQTLSIDSEAALKRMTTADPGLQDFLDKSYGYAIFPSIGKGGFVVGGSYGRGEVYRQGQQVGYADVTALSAGLLAGGQTISELIVFATEQAFNNFTSGNYAFGANASIVALKAGAAGNAQFRDGVVTFVDTRGGLMGDLSLEGQRFRYQPRPGGGGGGRNAEPASFQGDPAMRDQQEQLRNEQDRERRELQRQHEQERQQLQQDQREVQENVRQEAQIREQEQRQVQQEAQREAEQAQQDAREAQQAAEEAQQAAQQDAREAQREAAEAQRQAEEAQPTPEPATDDGPAIRGEVEVGPNAAESDDAQPRGTSGQAGQSE